MEQVFSEALMSFGFTVMRYAVVAGVFFIVFYRVLRSKLGRAKIQERKAAGSDFIREVKYSLVSSFVFAMIAMLLMVPAVGKYTLIYTDVNEYPLLWLPASVALSLVIHDTYFYWIHRLLHLKRIFPIAHLVHHRSTNPSPWAAYSFHIAESVLEGGVLIVLAFLVPMHPMAIVGFVLSSLLINVYGHLGYEVMPRWFRHSIMFEVFNTSVHHNLHHSKFRGNYGLYFRIWDRVMGTEHPDYVKEYDKIQQRRFGHSEDVKQFDSPQPSLLKEYDEAKVHDI